MNATRRVASPLHPLLRRSERGPLYFYHGLLSEDLDGYVVAAKLGGRADVAGSLVLAEEACRLSRSPIAKEEIHEPEP